MERSYRGVNKEREEMLVNVDAKELTGCLQIVSSIINPKNTELLRRQVLVNVSEDGMLLKTVNEYAMMSATVTTDIKETGKICVDVFSLIGLVSKFAGNIQIGSVQAKSGTHNVLVVSSGRSEYKIPDYPLQEFEPLTEIKEIDSKVHKVDLKQLKEALSCIYSSADKEHEALSGVYVAHSDTYDSLTCSDIQLGAHVRRKDLIDMPEGILPKFLIDFIMRLSDLRYLEYKEENGYYFGCAGKFRFGYRTPNCSYPWAELKNCIDESKDADKSFTFNKAHLYEALHRIGVVADDKTHAVRINIKNSEMELLVEGPGYSGKEYVDLTEPVDFEYSILVDGNYMLGILKEFEGPVSWSFTTSDLTQFITDGYLLKFFVGLVDD
jgi:DNA polymerase III sliding clamp (beta) subunit (PCNA family)